ncbi:hypothetical protein OAF23_04780 [Flavobacteriaceae bacterium]|nr:hypothetical protein [Flavobacteriaceae bacterium]
MDAKNDSELIVGFDKEIDENNFKKLNNSGKLEDVYIKKKLVQMMLYIFLRVLFMESELIFFLLKFNRLLT